MKKVLMDSNNYPFFLDKIKNNAIIIYTSKGCNMAETLISDIIDIIKENFYLMDVNFNDEYCDLLFNEIFKTYFSLNRQSEFRKEIVKFISICSLSIDKDEDYDYHLFLDNLHYLALDDASIKKIYDNITSQIAPKVY